jgi:DNA-directed RNA polymerase subunit RPC12/RpoP
MVGRYGTDALNQFLNIAVLVLLVLALLTSKIWAGLSSLCYVLALIALVLCYYRTFSRNISKRTEENYKFYTAKERAAARLNTYKEMWANRKQYHYYRCTKCHQKLRVPRGRGRIQISCPRCGNQFIKKS